MLRAFERRLYWTFVNAGLQKQSVQQKLNFKQKLVLENGRVVDIALLFTEKNKCNRL